MYGRESPMDRCVEGLAPGGESGQNTGAGKRRRSKTPAMPLRAMLNASLEWQKSVVLAWNKVREPPDEGNTRASFSNVAIKREHSKPLPGNFE